MLQLAVASSSLWEMPQLRLLQDEISFNAGISACVNRAQWEVALSLLRERPQLRLMPNVISFKAGISACEEGAQWEVALSVSVLWERPQRDPAQR
jgi:hypothetical protein